MLKLLVKELIDKNKLLSNSIDIESLRTSYTDVVNQKPTVRTYILDITFKSNNNEIEEYVYKKIISFLSGDVSASIENVRINKIKTVIVKWSNHIDVDILENKLKKQLNEVNCLV